MITKVKGKLLSLGEGALTLEVGAFEHQIFVPEFARRQLQAHIGEEISLHTIEYIEGDPTRGKLTPRMIGFLTEPEREFFELFCSVDGVGVKKALRAMVRPVQEVATAIEEQDTKSLSGLPGIGPATAERVVAKLRRKVPKFALIVLREEPTEGEVSHDVARETFEVLRQLGHSEADARRLIDTALEKKKKYKDVESLLQAVYDQRGG